MNVDTGQWARQLTEDFAKGEGITVEHLAGLLGTKIQKL